MFASDDWRKVQNHCRIIRLRLDQLNSTKFTRPPTFRNGGHDGQWWFEDLQRHQQEIATMAGVKRRASKQADWKGFANVRLDEAQLAEFAQWDVQDDEVWNAAASDVQAGYKFTSAYNAQNDTFSATYTCMDAANENAGLSLSAFAPDFYTAVRLLLYKHHVITNYQWSEYTSPATTRIG